MIDDNPIIRDVFSQVLAMNSYNVQTAKDNNEALIFLGMDHYDLILVDLRMPGMSTLDFLNTLKKQARTKHIPVMCVTAWPNKLSKKIHSKINSYLKKPFEPKTFLSSIESTIANSTQMVA